MNYDELFLIHGADYLTHVADKIELYLSHQASLQNKVFRSMIKEKEGGDVPCGFC